jgi:hypothetical protein
MDLGGVDWIGGMLAYRLGMQGYQGTVWMDGRTDKIFRDREVLSLHIALFITCSGQATHELGV